MKKKILLAVAGVLLVLVGIAAGFAYRIFMKPNVNTQSEVYHYLFVTPGMTWREVQDTLNARGWVGSPWTLEQAISFLAKDKTPQCGKYDLEIGIPNRLFINRLAYGLTNKTTIEIRMTRYPEWVARNLAPQVLVDSADIADVLLSDEYLQRRGFTRENALAMFVRGESSVQWCLSAEELGDVLEKSYNDFWTPERRALAKEMNLTPIEVHILASIVEEETNDYEDRRNVAGVYVNRLKKNMPLQACPTARYASGDFTLNRILKKHTQIKSPYNTYVNTGLPPGPIRIPGRESIDAVLHYAHHKYLYMCAKSDFSGTHNFSATLAQHNVYAREYQRELNKRRIGLK
ncbi:MAG: endolytic transglycosylase MltG [Paludibacteraceae bacterium]|nr:endolytic transglycosylase MltG [Paludibacteraceae bacterium]